MSIEKLDFDTIERESIPFVTISTFVVQNIKNLKAGFIWIYLHSLPSDWNVNKAHLMKHFGFSERDYQRHMSYLRKCNLVRYQRNRKDDGTLGPVTIIVLNGLNIILDKDVDHTAKFGIVDQPHRQITTPPKPTVVVPGTLTNTIDLTNTINPLQIGAPEKPRAQIDPNYEYPDTYFEKKAAKPKNEFLQDNPHNIPSELIEEWVSVRRKRRASLTTRVWKEINKQLSQCAQPIAAFEEMLMRGWVTVKAEWINKGEKNDQDYGRLSNSWDGKLCGKFGF